MLTLPGPSPLGAAVSTGSKPDTPGAGSAPLPGRDDSVSGRFGLMVGEEGATGTPVAASGAGSDAGVASSALVEATEQPFATAAPDFPQELGAPQVVMSKGSVPQPGLGGPSSPDGGQAGETGTAAKGPLAVDRTVASNGPREDAGNIGRGVAGGEAADGPARAGGLLSGTGGREASGVVSGLRAPEDSPPRPPVLFVDPGGRGGAMASFHADGATKSAPGEFSVVARDDAKPGPAPEISSGVPVASQSAGPSPVFSGATAVAGQRFTITDGEPFGAQGPGLSEMRSGATAGAVLPALPARTSAGRGEDGGQPVEARSGNRARADLEARLADTPVQRPGRTTGGAEGMGIVKVRYRSGQTGLEPGTASAGTAATFPLAAKPPQTRAAPPDGAPALLAGKGNGPAVAAPPADARGPRDVTGPLRDLPGSRLDGGGLAPGAGGTPAVGAAGAMAPFRVAQDARTPSAAESLQRLKAGETGRTGLATAPEFLGKAPAPTRPAPVPMAVTADFRAIAEAADGTPAEARSLPGEAEALAIGGDAPSRSGAPVHSHPFAGLDHARAFAVTRQIAEATGLALDGTLEVSLSPEELGRVKLTMTPQEAGLTIAIQAERPETLDLLRRHIDILARELADQGFTSVSFDFGQAGGKAGQGSEGAGPSANLPDVADGGPEAVVPAHPGGSVNGGLDLRL